MYGAGPLISPEPHVTLTPGTVFNLHSKQFYSVTLFLVLKCKVWECTLRLFFSSLHMKNASMYTYNKTPLLNIHSCFEGSVWGQLSVAVSDQHTPNQKPWDFYLWGNEKQKFQIAHTHKWTEGKCPKENILYFPRTQCMNVNFFFFCVGNVYRTDSISTNLDEFYLYV